MVSKHVLLGAILSAAMVVGASTGQGAEKAKVGFVYVGPIGDHGWSYQHNQGRLAIARAFGDQIKTT